ncbi:Vco29 [Boothiomyces macroporosus]|uniref:Vco29 n=1 Tax=Boothiomyces macroporosus TaxID=261099 RepID=A0AAD5UJW0_9FUNG|nr:Vco29 [Boothiomyces macroporosus]
MAALGLVSVVVKDYDKAIDFYVNKAGFYLQQDERLSETKRWVVVCPDKSSASAGILLAKADSPEQNAVVGNQGGGRVWLFLHVKDFWNSYNQMKANGVEFLEQPREEVYGCVCVWQDLYGNKWDLLEKK